MAPGTRDEGVPGAAEGRKGLRGPVDGYVLGVAAISAGLAAFLLLRLHALPPHEDETLVFFVTHGSFTDMLGTVLGERGGAPLHYLLAWLAGLVDPGLTSLRLISVAFAVASMPVIAALVARLSDRRTALVATLLATHFHAGTLVFRSDENNAVHDHGLERRHADGGVVEAATGAQVERLLVHR